MTVIRTGSGVKIEDTGIAPIPTFACTKHAEHSAVGFGATWMEPEAVVSAECQSRLSTPQDPGEPLGSCLADDIVNANAVTKGTGGVTSFRAASGGSTKEYVYVYDFGAERMIQAVELIGRSAGYWSEDGLLEHPDGWPTAHNDNMFSFEISTNSNVFRTPVDTTQREGCSRLDDGCGWTFAPVQMRYLRLQAISGCDGCRNYDFVSAIKVETVLTTTTTTTTINTTTAASTTDSTTSTTAATTSTTTATTPATTTIIATATTTTTTSTPMPTPLMLRQCAEPDPVVCRTFTASTHCSNTTKSTLPITQLPTVIVAAPVGFNVAAKCPALCSTCHDNATAAASDGSDAESKKGGGGTAAAVVIVLLLLGAAIGGRAWHGQTEQQQRQQQAQAQQEVLGGGAVIAMIENPLRTTNITGGAGAGAGAGTGAGAGAGAARNEMAAEPRRTLRAVEYAPQFEAPACYEEIAEVSFNATEYAPLNAVGATVYAAPGVDALSSSTAVYSAPMEVGAMYEAGSSDNSSAAAYASPNEVGALYAASGGGDGYGDGGGSNSANAIYTNDMYGNVPGSTSNI
jgi:hypothetical protein